MFKIVQQIVLAKKNGGSSGNKTSANRRSYVKHHKVFNNFD